MPAEPPGVFVSYSWTNETHTSWVAELSRRLRANGVDVHLDQWDTALGSDLNLYMERYAAPTARVLVILSDDYKTKADERAERPSGVATETSIVSPTVYQDLGGKRVIPVIPASGTVAGEPRVPTYLKSRNYVDFRGDYEAAYEKLLRDLHEAPIEPVPPLGPNPFTGTTDVQARALIHNDPARWRNSQPKDRVEVNLNENSGFYNLGQGEARFHLWMDYPSSDIALTGAPKRVRHMRDHIGHIGLVIDAGEHADRLGNLSRVPMSNRIEQTEPGDVLVMLNDDGYWALLIHDDTEFRQGLNGIDPVAHLRYVIATDRSPNLSLDDMP